MSKNGSREGSVMRLLQCKGWPWCGQGGDRLSKRKMDGPNIYFGAHVKRLVDGLQWVKVGARKERIKMIFLSA